MNLFCIFDCILKFMTMNKTNFALISALYDIKGADFYKDIYFPIIKYELSNLYVKYKNEDKYFSVDELRSAINQNFGIVIPVVVLCQTMQAISSNQTTISIEIYNNGMQFQIKSAWDVKINDSIILKSQQNEENLKKLDDHFKDYLKNENLTCDRTLIDFYSDNTEEILSYFNKNSTAIINENYVNIAKFLSWLKDANSDLYGVANDIFWAAIIAGFLKRDVVDVNIKAQKSVEYFLDSSLVLAALDLDSSDNVTYAKELINIINLSGNVACVHPITIQEIRNILYSVDREGKPRPGSAMEEAYIRRKLTPSKILNIHNNLLNLVTQGGLKVFPNYSETMVKEIEDEYKNKSSVKELSRLRGSSIRYENNGLISNSFREIHDIFMYNYVRSRRKNVVYVEQVNIFFVSLNSDLITFCNCLNSAQFPVLIHPAKITMDLWIHCSNSSFVKKNGLTEIMSRCFALNNTDIRRKLRLVSQYYNQTNSDYSQENYQALYNALIRRSAKAIQEVNLIIDNEEQNIENKDKVNSEHIKAMVDIAIEEAAMRSNINSELSSQNTNLNQEMLSLREEAERRSKLLDEYKLKQIQSEQQIKQIEREGRLKDEKIDMLNSRLNTLSKITKFNSKIAECRNELEPLEKSKNQSISYFRYWVRISFEVFGIVFLIYYFVRAFVLHDITLDTFFTTSENWISSLVSIFSLIFLIPKITSLYIFSPIESFYKHKQSQIQIWKERNPKYMELVDKMKDFQKQLTELQKNE